MHVRSGGTTGRTHQGYNLALLDRLAFLNQQRGTMTIASGITVTMVNFNHVSIAKTLVRPSNDSSSYSDNLGSFLGGYIEALVQFPANASFKRIIPVAKIRRHPALDYG